jgi:death-on-curing protein
VTEYLDLDDLMAIAERAIGAQPLVADYGLLEAALARPSATVFGADAYRTIHAKAAALLESLIRNHALVDGNKRLAWHATVVFCYLNGQYIDAPDDDAYDLVIEVDSGGTRVRVELDVIATMLAAWSRPV